MRRKILSNFGSIGLTRTAQLVFPLITIPYLARVIGVEAVGRIAFVQAIMTYLSILPDLGIGLYGPRQIALHQNEPAFVQEMLSNVFVLKVIASGVALTILGLLIVFVSPVKKHAFLFMLSAPILVTGILSVNWYFLGMQKMWGFSIASLAAFMLNAAGIFLLIKTPSDFWQVILLGSATSIVPGIYAIGHLRGKGLHLIRLRDVTFIRMKRIMLDAIPLYSSLFFGALYNNIFVIVMGVTTTERNVGIYSAAEKLIKAGLTMFSTFGQALYPFLSRAYASESRQLFKTFRITALITLGVAVLMGSVTFLGAHQIVSIVYGERFAESVFVLKILAFLFILLGINDSCGMQFFIPLGRNEKQFYATLIGLITAFVVAYPLSQKYPIYGMAISYLTTEASIAAYLAISLVRYLILENRKLKIG